MFSEKIYSCPYCEELISILVACDECLAKLENFFNSKKLRTRSCDEINAPFVYDGLVRNAVLSYKFGGRFDSCVSFAFFMKKCFLSKVDLVVAVPSFKNKERFKIIKNLVKAFVAQAHLKASFSVVEKVKETKRQHECGLDQRLVNLEGAFKINHRRKVLNKSILICDDIVTSGSTVDEIAGELKKAGAKRVSAIAIAVSRLILKHGLAKLL